MSRILAALFALLVVATACRKKQEPAPAVSSVEQEKQDHEIGISNLQIAALPTGDYELTVDVHDPNGDLTPQQRAVAKYQIVCPGGSAHGVLSEPTQLVEKDGRLIARHRVGLSQVKKGTEPCRVTLAVGNRYDFLSNELAGVLPKS